MATDNQPALQPPELLPCPWCEAIPRPLKNHYVVDHKPSCYEAVFSGALTTQHIYGHKYDAWNTRARVRDGVVAAVDLKDLRQRADDLPAACEHGNLDSRDVDRLIESIGATAPIAAPVDDRPHCWHCGVVLAYAPKLRCEDCPTECDVENCDAFGCAAPQDEQK